MKNLIYKITNILIPIIITVLIFISGNMGQRISEIFTFYIIDVDTINNRFITLDIFASAKDIESYNKTKNDLNEQMKQFNSKYENGFKESNSLENKKKWIDRAIYLLTVLLIIFNAVFTGNIFVQLKRKKQN